MWRRDYHAGTLGRNVARATADGGFYPPFMLDPIDFAAIYIARQQQIAQQPPATGQA